MRSFLDYSRKITLKNEFSRSVLVKSAKLSAINFDPVPRSRNEFQKNYWTPYCLTEFHGESGKNNRFSPREPLFWYNTFFYIKMALKEKSLNKNRQHILQENFLGSCSPLLAYHLKGQHRFYTETRDKVNLDKLLIWAELSSPLAIVGITVSVCTFGVKPSLSHILSPRSDRENTWNSDSMILCKDLVT